MECYNCGGAHLARDCPGGAVCLLFAAVRISAEV